MLVGPERLILPEGRVPRRAWPELAFAMLFQPEPKELAVWIGRLERTLGVNDDHRRAMEDRAFAAVESSADRRRRRLEEHRRAASLRAPMQDEQLVLQIAEKAAAAAALRTQAAALRDENSKRNRRAAKVLESKAKALDDEAAARRARDAHQIESWGAAREPILWAERRGEMVHVRESETAEVARDRFGARIVHADGEMAGLPALVYSRGARAKKLTGIEHAFAAGYLGDLETEMPRAERLREMGIDYRDVYEIAEGRTGRSGEGGGGGGGPKAPQPRLVEAGEDLADMRRGLTTRQRNVLDLVCGQDFRGREAAAKLGASWPATRSALCSGLIAARAALVAGRKRRDDSEDMSVGLKVQLVTQELRKRAFR
jgi:hypothetical protein